MIGVNSPCSVHLDCRAPCPRAAQQRPATPTGPCPCAGWQHRDSLACDETSPARTVLTWLESLPTFTRRSACRCALPPVPSTAHHHFFFLSCLEPVPNLIQEVIECSTASVLRLVTGRGVLSMEIGVAELWSSCPCQCFAPSYDDTDTTKCCIRTPRLSLCRALHKV